jgi:hypothetical protein
VSPRYGRRHRVLRAREARRVATGTVRCARCGGLIHPGTAWDLGHVDGTDVYAGPEHASCNRATRSHMPPRRRPREAHPGAL